MVFRFVVVIFIVLLSSSFNVFSEPEKALTEAVDDLSARLKKDRQNKAYLKQMSELLINKGDYPRTIYYSRQLDSIGQRTNDEVARMYASIYLGQALMMNGEEQEARYYLDKSLKQANSLSHDSALCSVYNGLGLYASNVDMDYYRAISYFFQGIEAAKRSSNERLYSILLCNIAGIYYLKKNPEGLKYALECYELGHRKRDAYLIFCGATNSAYMYFLLDQLDESLRYIKEAEFLMEKNKFHDETNLYNLYGNILLKSGDDAAAMEMFDKALQYRESSHTSSIANTYLSVAKAFIRKGNYPEAIRSLRQGLDISLEKNNAIYTSELYEYLSKVSELQGNYPEALSYYKTYSHLSDSLFNSEKERSLSELRVKYDLEKQENEIKQGKEILLQNEKKMQYLLFAFVLIVFILSATYLSYYRKNKLYLQIVKRNQEAVKRESALLRELNELKESTGKDPEKYSVSSLSDEKGVKLYEKLEKLMRDEHIYRQNNLNVERLAILLGTNRTYLSQVINKHTNSSFTHYINTFRIDDAVRLLSDPDNETPLKAISADLGFNSIATFYSAFQASVGMSPSLYREKVRKLRHKT